MYSSEDKRYLVDRIRDLMQLSNTAQKALWNASDHLDMLFQYRCQETSNDLAKEILFKLNRRAGEVLTIHARAERLYYNTHRLILSDNDAVYDAFERARALLSERLNIANRPYPNDAEKAEAEAWINEHPSQGGPDL